MTKVVHGNMMLLGKVWVGKLGADRSSVSGQQEYGHQGLTKVDYDGQGSNLGQCGSCS